MGISSQSPMEGMRCWTLVLVAVVAVVGMGDESPINAALSPINAGLQDIFQPVTLQVGTFPPLTFALTAPVTAKATSSTSNKASWITTIKNSDGETTGLEIAVNGNSGTIMQVNTAAVPSSKSSFTQERQATTGQTSDSKKFYATSFKGQLALPIASNGQELTLGFIKLSVCKLRTVSTSSSTADPCADTEETEEAQQSQLATSSSRSLLGQGTRRRRVPTRRRRVPTKAPTKAPTQAPTVAPVTCCTVKKVINHCKVGNNDCQQDHKTLAGMIV